MADSTKGARLCGDFGGVTAKGEPCRRKAKDGPCGAHRTDESVAHSEDAVAKPADWDKAVAAAYLRLTGNSQEASADGAGIGRRTLIRYEKSDWWPAACEEAADRWLSHLVQVSRQTVFRSIKAGNASMAMSVLERADHRLMPAAQRHELSGPKGGPIEVQELTDEELAERARQLTNRVGALAAADGPSTNGKH